MSTPGKVGPPVSSPIPACLLEGQPSWREGQPLAQGGQRFHVMIWRYRHCCPNESQVALPGQSAKTTTMASILLDSSGLAFWGALMRISPFIPPTQECQISGDKFSSLSITLSQLDDLSITPESFFTLGKSGKPNQSSWILPFRVLGKCLRRCKTRTVHWCWCCCKIHSWADYSDESHVLRRRKKLVWKRTGNLTSYNDLAQLTNPIGQIFHETLCAKITADGGDYRVIFLGQHTWEGCRDWFYYIKILNLCSIAHGSLIQNNFHNARQRDCFLRTLEAGAAFLSGKSPMPIDDAKKAHYFTLGASRSLRRKLMISRRKQRIYCWKRSD